MPDIATRLCDNYNNWGLGSKGPSILLEAANEIKDNQQLLVFYKNILRIIANRNLKPVVKPGESEAEAMVRSMQNLAKNALWDVKE